jgi:hypothetical protein
MTTCAVVWNIIYKLLKKERKNSGLYIRGACLTSVYVLWHIYPLLGNDSETKN